MAFGAGADRLDRRQVDLVAALREAMIPGSKSGTAGLAMRRLRDHTMSR